MAALGVGACSSQSSISDSSNDMFRDRKNDYRYFTDYPRMQVPEGMSAKAIADIYVVPPLSANADKDLITDLSLLPETMVGAKAAATLEQLDGDKWVLIHASPSQIWPRFKDFLAQKQLAVVADNAGLGLIRALDSAVGSQSGYYFKIEQGMQRNTAELSVRFEKHVDPISAEWPARSDDAALEQAMLDAVLQLYSQNTEKTAYSFAARGISTQQKMQFLVATDGTKSLSLAVSAVRAQSALRTALTRSGFVIEKEDAASNSLDVRYMPPLSEEKQPSWWDEIWRTNVHGYDEAVPYAGHRYRIVTSSRNNMQQIALARMNAEEGLTPTALRNENNQMLSLMSAFLQ